MRPDHLRSHSKNPTLIRPKTGLENLSADVAQLAYTKRNVNLYAINNPMALLQDIMMANPHLAATMPVQMTFTAVGFKFATGQEVLPPVLVCPRNALRRALIITQCGIRASNRCWYTLGPPLKPINDTSGGAGVPTERYIGIPIQDGNFAGASPPNVASPHVYIDEICPIDDVWLFTRGIGVVTNPGMFQVLEGTIPPDGNPL